MLDNFLFECIVLLKDGRSLYFNNLYIFELFSILDNYFNSDVEDIKIRKYVESND